MKTEYKAYVLLSFIYIVLTGRYLLYLWNFNCDGFGCFSILLFSGPITLGFFFGFAFVIFKYLIYTKNKELNIEQLNDKMKSSIRKTIVPFGLFTIILIVKHLL